MKNDNTAPAATARAKLLEALEALEAAHAKERAARERMDAIPLEAQREEVKRLAERARQATSAAVLGEGTAKARDDARAALAAAQADLEGVDAARNTLADRFSMAAGERERADQAVALAERALACALHDLAAKRVLEHAGKFGAAMAELARLERLGSLYEGRDNRFSAPHLRSSTLMEHLLASGIYIDKGTVVANAAEPPTRDELLGADTSDGFLFTDTSPRPRFVAG